MGSGSSATRTSGLVGALVRSTSLGSPATKLTQLLPLGNLILQNATHAEAALAVGPLLTKGAVEAAGRPKPSQSSNLSSHSVESRSRRFELSSRCSPA